MKFSLVDRITDLRPGESITGVKTLSLAEEYLADHFPGFPVLPGVLMLEALTQLSAWLVRVTDDFQDSVVMLKQAKAVKFNHFLTPGKTMDLNATLSKREEKISVFKVTGTIEGVSSFSARLFLTHFNLADSNPELTESDQLRIEEYRQQLNQIWSGANS